MLRDSDKEPEPDLILIATGTEVHICALAADMPRGRGHRHARRQHALHGALRRPGPGLPRRACCRRPCRARVSVEAAATFGWHRWVGELGEAIGMETFGASAPASALYKHFGFTPENVVGDGTRRGEASKNVTGGGKMSTATEVNPRLKRLTEAGVSVWLDQIRRSLTEGGELERLVAEDSLRGVTSNPSIFAKAILGSKDYDDELVQYAREQLDAEAIYDRIAIRDVQLAADVLSDVHRESNGRDGFVSLEVAPDMAHDEQRSIEAARTYWKALDRPNVMIKIPGTPEGEGAIEQAIYEGINVNVTLLFSVESYQAIAEAYIRGLERRHAEGLSLDVNSVASFFVSRVDTLVDRKLEELGRTDLAGTAALANARAAYAPLQGALLRSPLGHPARRGRRRPAAAVGLDRNQEPALPRHDVRRRAGRAAHRQHDADGDAARRRRPQRGDRADRRRGPHRRARGARSGGNRHAPGHRGAAHRRGQAVRGRDERAAGRDRGAPRRGQRPCAPAAAASTTPTCSTRCWRWW